MEMLYGIAAASQMLGLAGHPAHTAPTPEGLVVKVLEHPCRLVGLGILCFSLPKFVGNPN
jgi:hypothetical protein